VEQTYAAYVWPAHIPIVVHVINSTASAGGGGEVVVAGGFVACSFVASSGKWFGSPDGSPARGFNELNGWVAAWGPSGGGVRIALMPGITPPDSTNTGASYTVELNNVQIGTLAVSGGAAGVSIAGTMPDFMQVARIWLEPGGHILYDNGPKSVAVLAPGTYQVKATLRAKPRPDIYGSEAYLTLRCGDTAATITLRVPNPNEWGLRADIYKMEVDGTLTYRGTWSVGAIGYWEDAPTSSPYFSGPSVNSAPKWVAYWIDPTATSWVFWAVKFTGRLHVPWSNIRVGVHHDDGITVRLCNIDFTRAEWGYSTMSGTCAGAPREYSVEVWLGQGAGGVRVVFIIGPASGNAAYIPTIDGAWFCPNFDWTRGRCSASWSFVPASQSVPHFVAMKYTPGFDRRRRDAATVNRKVFRCCLTASVWGVSSVGFFFRGAALLSSVMAYMPLITAPTRALTYVANFSGVGVYVVFDSSLGVIFGVYLGGGRFTALCGGSSTPLGSLLAAMYVELRPLSGLGNVIIKDQYGAILARYGCRYTAAPQYVGFRSGLLRVYSVVCFCCRFTQRDKRYCRCVPRLA
jgi:hypothetical protein